MSKRKPVRTIKARVCIRDPFEGGRQRSAQGASEFEAGVGAGTALRTERRHDRHRHALHRLATAHGARLPGRRGAQEARTQAGVGEDGRRARVSDCCRQGFRRCHACAECVAMRGHVKRSEFHWRSLPFQAVNWISLCKRFFAALSATCFSSCVSLCFLGLILSHQHSELMFDGDRCRKFDFSSEPVIAHWTLL